ncbi:MAG TPA: NADH-quinone oxidoreductase subunit N [Myxococcota bacterium]|nr:NADH-quinone oxidoreductase subunit N [Myxococcota bacterium]HRY96544.1 NADH-quinone oxidoreductase subunit N [Myxococcota bacterium]
MQGPLSSLASLPYVTPELLVGGAAVVVLLLSAFVRGPAGRWLFPLLSLAALLGALAWLVWFGLAGGCLGLLFGGLLACDRLGLVFRGLVLAAAALALVLSAGSPTLAPARRGEYHGLVLALTAALGLLACVNHLLMLYVAIESVSLLSYLLTGWDKARGRSLEAALKYALYGGVASAVGLFGMSLLYGLLGDLSLQGLHTALVEGTALASPAGQWAAWAGLVCLLAGLGFKVAAVPFHMWAPDAYEGAPTPFAGLLSVAPKAAAFAVLLRVLWGLFSPPGSLGPALDMPVPWLALVGGLSALSMTLGNLTALVQDSVKRMLAYSSIAHAGYILLGVLAGGQDGFESVSLYLIVYALMNLGAFAAVSAVSRAHPDPVAGEQLGAFRGLGRRSPLLALALAVLLISLIGLPPTAGFVGKLYLFAAVLWKGGFWYVLLAVVGVVNAVISLAYYARVLKAMYLEAGPEGAPAVPAGNTAGLVAVVTAVAVLALGVFWQPLAVLATWSTQVFY